MSQLTCRKQEINGGRAQGNNIKVLWTQYGDRRVPQFSYILPKLQLINSMAGFRISLVYIKSLTVELRFMNQKHSCL